jgi:DNA-binding XRE family transcriptional regulator
MKDTLNLKYHQYRLIKIALSKYDMKKDAAEALGISTKTLKKLEDEIYENRNQKRSGVVK